jgi:hypothetical protein
MGLRIHPIMVEGRLVAEGKAGEYLSIPGTLLGYTNESSCRAIRSGHTEATRLDPLFFHHI